MNVDDIIKHRVYLEMQKNRINKNSLNELKTSIKEFEEILKYIKSKDYKDLPENIKKEIDLIIDIIFKNYTEKASDGIIEVVKYEGLYTSKSIESLIKSKIILKTITTDQAKTFLENDILDLSFTNTLKKQNKNFKDIFKANMEIGIKDGLSTEKIANMMRLNINQKTKHLETLTRTVFQNAMNLTSTYVYEKNDKFVKKLKRSAVLDQLTTDICIKNNNKIYTIEESKGVLPAHYNCRSFFIPILDQDIIMPKEYKEFKKTQQDDIFKSDSEKGFKTSKEMTIKEMIKREDL